MIAGVCGGIAEYLDIDPTLVRLIMVLLFFANGTGFLFYLIAWLIIPLEPEQPDSVRSESEPETRQPAESWEESAEQIRHNPRFWAGIVLIITGVIFLLGNYIPWMSWDTLWPLFIIALGIYFILDSRRVSQ